MVAAAEAVTSADPSVITQSSWPASCPHVDSKLVLSVICGNSRYHWALHLAADQDFKPKIFWKTTPVEEDQEDVSLEKFLPPNAYEAICGPHYAAIEGDRSTKTIIKFKTQERVPYFEVYVISTNDTHMKGIPRLFAGLPCRCIQLQSRDFIPNAYEGLGVDRCATLYGSMSFYKNPVMVIDGGTAMTWTASDSHGRLRGGGILPGIGARFRCMHEWTGALPFIDANELKETIDKLISAESKPLSNFATSTKEAMLVGVLREAAIGLVSLVRSWAQGVRKGVGEADMVDLHVMVTGGDAWLLEKLLSPSFGGIIEDDGEATNGLKKEDRIEVVSHKNLGNHSIGELLSKQFVPLEKMSPDERLRTGLLGQRVVVQKAKPKGKKGAGAILRGTICDIFRGDSFTKDQIKVQYDNGSSFLDQTEDLYDQLLAFFSMGEDASYGDLDSIERKQIRDNAFAAAKSIAENVPSVKARIEAAAKAKAEAEADAKVDAEIKAKAEAKTKVEAEAKAKAEAAAKAKAETEAKAKAEVAAKRLQPNPPSEESAKKRQRGNDQSSQTGSEKSEKSPGAVEPIRRKQVLAQPPASFINKRVAKFFGPELYFGVVERYEPPAKNETEGLWHVLYDDGDNEDYDSCDMAKQMTLYEKKKAEDPGRS